jgi:hypothetical protein
MDTTEKPITRPGYIALWGWFSLSRAAWLTLPRVLMHEMPDAWQRDMARLLSEWDRTWRGDPAGVLGKTAVLRVGERGRFGKWPEWLTNYRHPDGEAIADVRGGPPLIELAVGDPRRAAWLQHMRNSGRVEVANHYDRSREALEVESEWPAESPEVFVSPLGLCIIPCGTPEHAAHLAAWRRQGRPGIQRALGAAGRQLREKARWPEIGGQS